MSRHVMVQPGQPSPDKRLSLRYDIVTKGNGRELKVQTAEGKYTECLVAIPVI